MATKKQNIRHQLRSELYRQFNKGKGTSRHENKQKRKLYGHHDLIYSRKSLKTHLSRAEQFAKWIKAEYPEIKRLEQITQVIGIEYLRQQEESGYYASTTAKDALMINHVQIGSGNWTRNERLIKSELGLKSRRMQDITNNRGAKANRVEKSILNDSQRRIVNFGEAFGLRRSELMPNHDTPDFAVTTRSLVEKEGRVYVMTKGKGGKFRSVECLKTSEPWVREEFGQYIRQVDVFPSYAVYKAEYARYSHLFKEVNNNINIQIECRQAYVNAKLDELEEDGRRFHLARQNQLKSGLETYTTNGRTMLRDHAQFVSEQLGHARIYELKSYVNLP